MIRTRIKRLYRIVLPIPVRQWFVRTFRYPYAGSVKFGDLKRTIPISRVWGLDRGIPVDRHYIEQFLAAWSADIHGRVLEIGENTYTMRYGGEQVEQSDILHVSAESPTATIIADLTQADHVPTDTFDCIICTQTLHLIFEVELAIATLHRILKPGGVLLATLPGISQISRYDMDRWGDYWRFTHASARRLFGRIFPPENLTVQVYGNVLAAIAFLEGLAVEDLRVEDLAEQDDDYQVLLGVRAVKVKDKA
jgi:SAM-dependent methyltransferase